MAGTGKLSIAVLALLAMAGPAWAEATVTAPSGAETNSIVAAAALAPDHCAVDLDKAGACADLVDSAAAEMTVNGPVPLADGTSKPASEEDLLLSLGARSQAIDAQKASLDQQALLLEAAEKRIAEREDKLSALENNINALVNTRDEQAQKQIDEMVSLYQNMKPKDAAAVMGGLPDDVLLQIASNIPARKMSAILAAMNPARARALTVMMVDQAELAQPQL